MTPLEVEDVADNLAALRNALEARNFSHGEWRDIVTAATPDIVGDVLMGRYDE